MHAPGVMRLLVATLVVAIGATALSSCATLPQHDSSYYDSLAVIAYGAKDYTTARQQWSKALAVDGKNARALNNLAYLLYNGMGGEHDRHRAVLMWDRAAHMRLAESQWHLGQAYEEGTAIEKSYTMAYAWFRCAIEGASETPKWAQQGPDGPVIRNVTLWLNALRSRMSVDEFFAGEQKYRELTKHLGPPLK